MIERALTIMQPFPAAILAGIKRVEYRARPILRAADLPCWVALHAGRKVHPRAELAYLGDRAGVLPPLDRLQLSAIVGVVEVLSVVDAGEDAGARRYQYRLGDAIVIDPIAAPGQLGAWRLPACLAEQVLNAATSPR